ncbi:hypothetical protein L2E82_49966 [Cichorium intybus]|nr:hypothetical protein L2E82_49966 [Cichorium intybus]
MHMVLRPIQAVSVKGKDFYNELKTNKVKGVTYMDSWMLIKLLEISILPLANVFNNQMCIFMILKPFKATVLI